MRKIGVLTAVVIFAIFSFSGCATIDNQKFGNKFFSDEIVWKEFSANTFVWLKDGIGILKSDDLISKFGGPVTTVQMPESVILEWEYREVSKKHIDYLIGQSQNSIENVYALIVLFNDAGKLLNFSISQTYRDGSGRVWTSKEVVEFGILAGTFYIGGRWVDRIINKAVKSGQTAP